MSSQQSEMSSRNCIVYPCRRRGGYRLPLNSEVRLKWLEAIKWPIIPLEPKKTAVVCPTHFTEHDFIGVGNGGKKILKDQAIPSVFPWNSNLWSKEEMEGTTALRSPSTSDEEEVEKSDAASNQSSESEIEVVSSSSSSEESSEDEAEAVAQIVADEIVTISSDDNSASSSTTSDDDPEKSPSAAHQGAVKRSAPSTSAKPSHPEKRRRLKKRQYDIIFTTSRSSSNSSEEEELPKKAEPDPVVSTSKKEDGEDSDESDCILCEKPIESIDLTADDRYLDLSPAGVHYDDSDSSYEESFSDEVKSLLGSLPPPVLPDKVPSHVEPISESDAEEENLMNKVSSSDDSDCAIIEDNPPTIELNSDEEDALTSTSASLVFNGNGRSVGVRGANLPEIDQPPDITFIDISPYVEVPSGPVDPFTDVSSLTVDPFAGVPETAVVPSSPPVPSSSGDLSPVASKDPNAPLIQRSCTLSFDKTARSRYNNQLRIGERMKLKKVISRSQVPRGFEIVGIHPSSRTLRIVLTRKKVSKPEVPEEMVVAVDPLTACLHDFASPVDAKQTSTVQVTPFAGNGEKTISMCLKDLVFEETHLNKVILLRRDETGFEPHCDALARKLVDIIRKSRVMAGRLSQKTIRSMYSLLFLTEISYGTIYWGHCDGAHRIFDLQKRFVGMIAKPKPEAVASRATFRQNGIMTLPSIYILHCLIHVHKNVDAIRKRLAMTAKRSIAIYEARGFEFYMALPPHLRRPHCNLPFFIRTVKKFLRQQGLFNALEYYDTVNTIPKIANPPSVRSVK